MNPSCYTCKFMPICYVRRNFWDALISSSNQLNDDVNKKVFEAVASGCRRYEFQKED